MYLWSEETLRIFKALFNLKTAPTESTSAAGDISARYEIF